MAYALVGSVGAVVQSSSGGSITTLAWGTGENRTAGNLLILFVSGAGSATLTSTPAGWSVGKQIAGTSCSASIFWKKAAGGDAAPTISAITSCVQSAQLAEFSGVTGLATPTDQTGSATGATSSLTPTNGAADAASGELVIVSGGWFYSTSKTTTQADSLNNGATANSTTNNATSTVSHYNFTWGITTGNSSADSDSITGITTTKLTGGASVIASFKAAQAFTQNLTATLTFIVLGFVTAGPKPAPYVRKLPLPWELLPR